jgi:hypothetical protein
MPTQEDFERLEAGLNNLIGETCDKIEWANLRYASDDPNYNQSYRKVTYENRETQISPNLSLLFGSYRIGTREAYYRVGLYGTWQIFQNSKSLCSYVGGCDRDGMLLQYIQIFDKQTVSKVIFDSEKFDFFIEFDNQYTLGIIHTAEPVSGFRFDIWHYRDSRDASGEDWTVTNGKISYGMWIS